MLSSVPACGLPPPRTSRPKHAGYCELLGDLVKTANQVRGRISVLDTATPNLWVIVSEQGIIGNPNPIYDGPDIVLPCNLPDSLKKLDVKVLFSGGLGQYQGGHVGGVDQSISDSADG